MDSSPSREATADASPSAGLAAYTRLLWVVVPEEHGMLVRPGDLPSWMSNLAPSAACPPPPAPLPESPGETF